MSKIKRKKVKKINRMTVEQVIEEIKRLSQKDKTSKHFQNLQKHLLTFV